MSTGLRLYEHTANLEAVHDLLMESQGVLTPEIEALLDAAEEGFDEKAEKVALKLREMEATAAAVKVEAKRLLERAAATENAAKGLKEYLHREMVRAERPEVKRPLVTLRVQNSPPAARCSVPVEALPPALVRVVPEKREFDASAALALYKEGAELPGGVEVIQGTHLRIR